MRISLGRAAGARLTARGSTNGVKSCFSAKTSTPEAEMISELLSGMFGELAAAAIAI